MSSRLPLPASRSAAAAAAAASAPAALAAAPSDPSFSSDMGGSPSPSDVVGPIAAAARNTEPTMTLREHITRQLRAGDYECCVCSDAIKSAAPTWSCSCCFRVYHFACVRQWAAKSQGTAPAASSASSPAGTGAGSAASSSSTAATGFQFAAQQATFRCPSCNSTEKVPTAYRCFCGRVADPKADPFVTPHSCGDVCGRKRSGGACTHGGCSLQCHPGPCDPCGFQAPSRACPCGRSTYSFRCGAADPKTTCDAVCGKPLACGSHTCADPCHHGPCTPCAVTVAITCYCSAETRELPCGSTSFACAHVCGKQLRCGAHRCDATCHRGGCPPCATDPSVVNSCPCGKVPLATRRIACTDPIPTCGQRCGRVLVCGMHECEELCHEGPCEQRCVVKRVASCPCGHVSHKVRCFEARTLACNHVCGANKSCGRHTCRAVCCPHRRDALPLAAVHQCRELCGALLLCGHRCAEPCGSCAARGFCPPCPNIIVENLSCGCGKQFRLAPLPCGTVLPPCTAPCPRPRECGHDALQHTCHQGPCPPCAEVVTRPCAGGHVANLRVQCSTDPLSITCGKACGHALPYCGHPCERRCHAGFPSACVAPRDGKKFAGCTAQCNALLKCGHRCTSKCHVTHAAPTLELATVKPCPPCTEVVRVACECGVQHIAFSCRDYERFRQEQPDAKAAPCNDDCPLLRRDAALRPAHLSAGGGGALVGAGAGTFSDASAIVFSCRLWTAAKEHVDFFCSVERTFADLLSAKANRDGFKKLNPMARERRGWVHELAAVYGIATESVDEEPKRAVLATRTPASREPSPKLSDAIYSRDDAGHNPFVLLSAALANRARAAKQVLVFEGERLTDVDVAHVLRPFGGRFVVVSGAEQLRTVRGLVSDASRRLRRGDINVALAVFTSPAAAAAAYSHVRKSLCKHVFHFFGDTAPPRNVEDASGRLKLVSTPAVAFADADDTLWEADVSATGAAPAAVAVVAQGGRGRGASKASAQAAASAPPPEQQQQPVRSAWSAPVALPAAAPRDSPATGGWSKLFGT
jgi:transcriptional repressor NF-X1